MAARALWLALGACALLLAMPSPGAVEPTASAQIGQIIPDVTITCDPSELSFEVYPGASRSNSSSCHAENPSIYSVVVSLQVESTLSYACPGSITISAGGETDFSIAWRADLRMEAGSHGSKLIYQVQTVNGIANPNPQPKELNHRLEIAPFGMVRLETTVPFTTFAPSEVKEIEFKVYNDGNQRDRIEVEPVGVPDGWRVELSQSVVEIEPQQLATVDARIEASSGSAAHQATLTLEAESALGRAGEPVTVKEDMTLNLETTVSKAGDAAEAGWEFLWDDGPTSVTWGLSGSGLVVLLAVLVARRRSVAAPVAYEPRRSRTREPSHRRSVR